MTIYVASKTKHFPIWQYLRAKGYPINSTWIDEAGEGETTDFTDLWNRCITEAKTADALVCYREDCDILKGAWLEIGAALSHGVPVFAVGLREYTLGKSTLLNHFDDLESAMNAALKGNANE